MRVAIGSLGRVAAFRPRTVSLSLGVRYGIGGDGCGGGCSAGGEDEEAAESRKKNLVL